MKFPEEPRSQEYTLEEKKRIKHLLEISKKNLQSPSLVGYHGTGLASLKLIIKTGKLLGSPIKWQLADSHGIGNKGDLHFFPRARGFPLKFDQSHLRSSPEDLTEEEAIKGAEDYAKLTSVRDIFMEIAGLDITNSEHNTLQNEFFPGGTRSMKEQVKYVYDHPEIYYEELDIAKKLKLGKSAMEAMALKMDKEIPLYEGVILGLDKKLLDNYKTKSGDETIDLFINCPDGLDYKLLCGLRALGKKEKEFLANLKTKI